MKFKSISAMAGLAMLCGGAPAFAQFGNFGHLVPGAAPPTAGQAAAPMDVDAFMVSIIQADELTRRSSHALFLAIASKEAVDKAQAERDAAKAVQDPKERDAALRKVDAEETAALATVNYDTAAAELEHEQNAEKNARVGAAMYNLALGVLRDRVAVAQGQGIVSAATHNPMLGMRLATRLNDVRVATGSVGSQMSSLVQISTGLPKLMKVAKVEKLPTAATDEPKSIAD